jgi:hypothetical protein
MPKIFISLLTELKHILRKTQQFFDEQESLEQGGAVGQHQQLIQVSPRLLLVLRHRLKIIM